jgi:uncharacterized FlaG/YvyC family protein
MLSNEFDKEITELFRVPTKNGNFKEFTNRELARDFIKKQKEQAEREAAEAKKAEEDRKRYEETEKALLSEINEVFNKLSDKVKAYEEATGKKLVYTYDYLNKSGKVVPTRNSIDFAWDYPMQQLMNILMGEK